MTATQELRPAPVAPPARRRPTWPAPAAGLVAGIVFLAAAELVAAFLGGAGSPLVAVGGAAIDLAPRWVKDLMVSTFGTGDKAALFVLMAVLFAAATAWAGVLERRRRLLGVAVFVIGAVLALVAVTTRSGSGTFDGAPTVVGAGAGIVVLRALIGRLRSWDLTATIADASAMAPADDADRGDTAGSPSGAGSPAPERSPARESSPAAERSPAATAGPPAAPASPPLATGADRSRAGGGEQGLPAVSRPSAYRDADRRAATLARRSFLRSALVTGIVAVAVGTGARITNAVAQAGAAARRAVRLPTPATTERAVPSGASLDVHGVTPYVTPNADFYRIDTALRVPDVDPTGWSLRIHGAVEHEVEIRWDELLALPLEEHMATLSCVSNEVGGDLIGNALWLGYPIRNLLARARPHASADMVLSRSVDGFTAGTPLDVMQDPGTAALVAVGMNGDPLPPEHGFPARLVVPGLYGYVSATKWVTELEITRFADAQGYWTPRGWSARGPVKVESRIDTPADGATVRTGDRVAIAGVAWQPHTGVKRVQVRVDDDAWQDAELADSVSADTWRQWVYRWTATAGGHTVAVRATNAAGEVQTSVERPPAPNGATGWDSIRITAR